MDGSGPILLTDSPSLHVVPPLPPPAPQLNLGHTKPDAFRQWRAQNQDDDVILLKSKPSFNFHLHDAVNHSNVNEVKRLIADGENVNQRLYFKTPLCLAMDNEELEIALLILNAGANPCLKDNEVPLKFRSPIHYAALRGYSNICKQLIAMGEDVNVKDARFFTPLHYAARNGHEDTVRCLVEMGADVNLEGVADESDIAAYLRSFNSKLISGCTPIHQAVCSNHGNVVKYLLKCGAKPNPPRALLESVTKLNHNIAKMLLKSGADVNYYGTKIFSQLCFQRHESEQVPQKLYVDMCKLLLNYGAVVKLDMLMSLTFIVNQPKVVDLLLDCSPLLNPKWSLWASALKQYETLTPDAQSLCDHISHREEDPILPLKGLCRLTVRHAVKYNISERVMQLPLPKALIKYLSFEEHQPVMIKPSRLSLTLAHSMQSAK